MSQSQIRKRLSPQKSSSPPSLLNNTSSSKSRSNTPERSDRPVHKLQDSLLSSSAEWENYRGFLNLAILLLIISNGRVALENLLKYGVLISPSEWFNWAPLDSSNWPMVTLLIWSNVSILLALFVEKLLAREVVENRFAVGFYATLITAHFTLSAIKVLNYDGNPLFSVWALAIVVIEGLKLVSYAHVNYWCRCARIGNPNNKLMSWSYPNNLTVSNVYYFMFAPTLCYELRFPRTPFRHKRFIFRCIIELITFSFLIIALTQQWIIPLMKNSIEPFSKMDLKHCMERLLKLAVPNHLLWLLGFYTIFHSASNLMAEVLRFGDREFYLDFWNSETTDYFWRTWNISVHRWSVRHLYKPIINHGHSSSIASVVVFLVSAFFHEYLISVPLHMFRVWAFNGMLAQIPLSFITDKLLRGGRSGNVAVWLSLILGQPLVILMYVNDYFCSKRTCHDQC